MGQQGVRFPRLGLTLHISNGLQVLQFHSQLLVKKEIEYSRNH